MPSNQMKCSGYFGFKVEPTDEYGIHSNRRRYKVTCIECMNVLHEATTGPMQRIEGHLRDS